MINATRKSLRDEESFPYSQKTHFSVSDAFMNKRDMF